MRLDLKVPLERASGEDAFNGEAECLDCNKKFLFKIAGVTIAKNPDGSFADSSWEKRANICCAIDDFMDSCFEMGCDCEKK